MAVIDQVVPDYSYRRFRNWLEKKPRKREQYFRQRFAVEKNKNKIKTFIFIERPLDFIFTLSLVFGSFKLLKVIHIFLAYRGMKDTMQQIVIANTMTVKLASALPFDDLP